MLFAFAVIFVVLWLLGVLGGYPLGGSVDVLLVIAVLLLVWELRRAVSPRE
jgi:hypothetical protein